MVASSRAQRILFVVLVALLTAIAVVLLIGPASSSPTPIAGSRFDGPTFPAGLRAANFSLTDQSGRRVTLARYRGHVVVLTFIHSLCKDTCPFMVEQIKGALNDLPNAGRGVPAIGVSVEPAQDTDHNRKAFLSRHELTGRLAFVAVNVANVGRALPSLALLAFALPVAFALGLGLGFWPTLIALVPLAIPPMLTNAYVGTRAVDRDVIESARGMGMAELGILRRIEIPLALPLVLAGMRTSAVNVVATATLGALVAGGGLGRYIVDGLALQEYDRLFAGALLVALLAIAVEVAFGTFERRATSPGLRTETATL